MLQRRFARASPPLLRLDELLSFDEQNNRHGQLPEKDICGCDSAVHPAERASRQREREERRAVQRTDHRNDTNRLLQTAAQQKLFVSRSVTLNQAADHFRIPSDPEKRCTNLEYRGLESRTVAIEAGCCSHGNSSTRVERAWVSNRTKTIYAFNDRRNETLYSKSAAEVARRELDPVSKRFATVREATGFRGLRAPAATPTPGREGP